MDHIARHGVEPDEAESVLDDNPLILRTEDGKYLAYGQTDEGRYLLVRIRPQAQFTTPSNQRT